MSADDEQPGAVLGATGKISTMADGSFRLVVEIEPRHAQEAFRLFGAPGTPVAIARIMPAVMLREDRAHTEEKLKGGPISRLAGQFCDAEPFRKWLRKQYDPEPRSAAEAAQIIRSVCRVDSRAELDHDDAAARIFHAQFRLPYNVWVKEGMQ